MTPELDLTRLAALQRLLGSELPEIAAVLLRELEVAIGELERARETGDLEAAAVAAHQARNSALMIGAEGLLGALRALERAAREEDAEAARTALADVTVRWPSLRRQLQSITAGE